MEMFTKRECTRLSSVKVALLVENGIIFNRGSIRFKGGFLPPNRTARLYGPGARNIIKLEACISDFHTSIISFTC